MTLDLSLDEGAVELAVGRYDAGIRQEESIEKDSATVRLTPPVRGAVVGSPDYFVRTGRPRKPEDLPMHEGILYRFVTSGQIANRSSQRFSVRPPSTTISEPTVHFDSSDAR